MPKVRFLEDFDWRVIGAKTRAVVAFKAGMVKTVTRLCAAQAIAARKAVPAESKPTPPQIEHGSGPHVEGDRGERS